MVCPGSIARFALVDERLLCFGVFQRCAEVLDEGAPHVAHRELAELDRAHEVHPVASATCCHVEALLEDLARERMVLGVVCDHAQEHDFALAALEHIGIATSELAALEL